MIEGREVIEQLENIKKDCIHLNPKIVILSLVYNQKDYLGDFFKGILSQKVSSPYVVIVHDDASNDGSTEVIMEYAQKYPEIIKPIIEKENQYSQGMESLTGILKEAVKNTGAEYVAFCEGDDYWMDDHKLQKQLEFMSYNPTFSLCTTNVYNEYKGRILAASANVELDSEVPFKDVVMKGGAYLSSPSLFFRSYDYLDFPIKAQKLYVMDYPLQIYLASIGKVIKLADLTCVHRVASKGSWTENNKINKLSEKFVNDHVKKETELNSVMNIVTEGKFSDVFSARDKVFRFHTLLFVSPNKSRVLLFKHFWTIVKYAKIKTILFCLAPTWIRNIVMKAD